MVSERILDKIKALLNRTEARGCTAAEAESAAYLVEKLLSDHNLSLDDLPGESKVPCGIFLGSVFMEFAHDQDWLINLSCAAAMLCGTKCVMNGAQFCWIGAEVDCLTSDQLFKYFVDSANSEADAQPVNDFGMPMFSNFSIFTNDQGRRTYSVDQSSPCTNTPAWKLTFKRAYAQSLGLRVQRHCQERDGANAGTAIVVHRTAEAQEWLEQNLPGIQKKEAVPLNRLGMNDWDAAMKGESASYRTQLGTEKAL